MEEKIGSPELGLSGLESDDLGNMTYKVRLEDLESFSLQNMRLRRV